ncbi:MAG: UDP-2,3-diacylglucosamine diphosphatase [Syntrophotaleaceae bacterium]
MKDIFLADAHLLDPAAGNYRRLLAFLADHRGSIRHLVMLGDIFDFWIGYRHTVFAPFVPLLEELRRQRESGTELIFVEGNHDFHMGPFFSEILQCRILPDGGELLLDDRKVFLAHGDLINPHDRGYLLLRKVLRNRLTRMLLTLVPPDLAWSVARRASRLSNCKKTRRQPRLPEKLLLHFAEERFTEGYDAVITGHFHVPLFRQTGDKTLIALGDWIDQDSYAVFEHGAFALRRA